MKFFKVFRQSNKLHTHSIAMYQKPILPGQIPLTAPPQKSAAKHAQEEETDARS
jgi:hypothetical protein